MKTTFNPPRDEDEDNGINDDYLALTQFPQYKDSPDFKNEDKRKEFLKKNNLRFLRKYQLGAIKAIQSKIKKGGDRFLLEMATGTGKTKVLSLLLVWSYFHKTYEEDSDLSRNFLLITPNIIVLDRIRTDFDGLKIFFEDPLLPPNGYDDQNWNKWDG